MPIGRQDAKGCMEQCAPRPDKSYRTTMTSSPQFQNRLNLDVLSNSLGAAEPLNPNSWLSVSDQNKATCLHFASFYLNPRLVGALLSYRADSLAEDCNGRLPLELAAMIAEPSNESNKNKADSDGEVHVNT